MSSQTVVEIDFPSGTRYYSFRGIASPNDYFGQAFSDAPVGYWRLGEASGTTAEDVSGHEKDGTYA